MSSSEEETSLIKTPQRPQGQGHDQGHSASSSSEKAKAERLRRQRELQAAFKERMREKNQESQRRAAELKEASQSVLEDPPRENAQGPVS